MNTAKLLMLQYDFRTAIPLQQAVHDYISPDISEKEINRRANHGEFPFPCYKAEKQKSKWFVNLESLAEWLDKKKAEAINDYIAKA